MEKYSVEKLQDGVMFFPSMKDVSKCHREWIYGDFVEGVTNSLFEVKISVHAKGDSRDEWSPSSPGEMLGIVESGSVQYDFQTPEMLSVIVHAGQMVRCPNTTSHKWKVLEDGTRAITIRSFARS